MYSNLSNDARALSIMRFAADRRRCFSLIV